MSADIYCCFVEFIEASYTLLYRLFMKVYTEFFCFSSVIL